MTDFGDDSGADRRLPVVGEDDIVQARSVARDEAKRLGFGMVDQSRIATAVSELARNVVRYAGSGGEALIRPVTSPSGRVGIEVVISDTGPGIADIDEAMREGYTSGAGLGMGLPGTKRLMDEMHLWSRVGEGTRVTIRKWRR